MSDYDETQTTGGDVRKALVQTLQDLHRAGVQQLSIPPAVVSPPTTPAASLTSTVPGTPASPGTPAKTGLPAAPAGTKSENRAPVQKTQTTGNSPSPSSAPVSTPLPSQPTSEPMPNLSLPKRREALHLLAEEVARCTKCKELVSTRMQTVFGIGTPKPRLCFFGEAPGADEDRQGEPFVGRSGQLLTKIIEACGMTREDVYILNVLKCRPPGNRNPSAEETAACRPFFERQLEILRPEFICCLGRPAMMALLGTPPTQSLGSMRGRFHNYQDAKVIVTYHPAYLLRNPPAKRDVWDDMQMLLREMGLEIPKRKS